MSNMSYCRFQNTLQDLRDCYEGWGEDLSPEETKAQKRLLKLCKDIVEDFGEDYE